MGSGIARCRTTGNGNDDLLAHRRPPAGAAMIPYYDADGITIYCGDCRDVLPGLAGVDLVLTDPPYGIQYQRQGPPSRASIHTRRRQQSAPIIGDTARFDPTPWLAFPHVALFGAQHYADRLPPSGTLHVWDKRGAYAACNYADFDAIWVNRREPGRIIRSVWRGICRETEHDQRFVHPTQKPLRVMRWVLDLFPAAGLVLDPYMGSGTTLRAAKDAGRRAIGIEIEEKYCEIAVRRLAQGVLL